MQKPLNEGKIRRILGKHLRDAGLAKGAALIPELCVADFGRRADLVLANGKLSAFEIKSDIDDLSRLTGQIATFQKYFESLTIVCAPRHTSKVLMQVPSTVGVWEVDAGQLVEVKRAAFIEIVDAFVWLSHLPVSELRSLLRSRSLQSSGLRPELVERAQQIAVEDLRTFVLDYFKRRKRIIAARVGRQVERTDFQDPVAANRRQLDQFIAKIGFVAGTRALPRRVQ
ncbi:MULTISPECIES: sce7726 family protein [unclassified Caballeronia]|uniref:sce7726 family protein n=1 Tax=unclassified Caballeronia TaxID=2646786 RepID=UPI00202821A0|nr:MULTISPECIES: sce7726 family protein [unclassified Caballeronia]